MSKCLYRGPLCMNGTTVNLTAIFPDGSVFLDEETRYERNVSCSERIEYCTLPPQSTVNEFQCYSIFEVKENGERVEDRSGCILGHTPKLCSPRYCNFSHDIKHSWTHREYHYCCCHTDDLCNDGIIGWSKPTPTSTSSWAGELRKISFLIQRLGQPGLQMKILSCLMLTHTGLRSFLFSILLFFSRVSSKMITLSLAGGNKYIHVLLRADRDDNIIIVQTTVITFHCRG